ncbi:hypothetical protein WJX77_007036 [Trebouxia sp. C0004]
MTTINVSAPEAPTVKTKCSNKRSRQTFESILAVIDKNVASEPQPLPKRPLNEAQLLAQYAAERAQPQQQQLQAVARSPSTFQYTPRKPPATEPSLFSPATSKAYASPVSNNSMSRHTPVRQGTLLPAQQSARASRSPMLFSASASLHSRLSQLPSRLGPSRMQAQPLPLPQIWYLDSAPVLVPAHPAAASTSHTIHPHQHSPAPPFLSSGYYAESPGPNSTPYRVQDQAELPDANGVNGLDTEPDEMTMAPTPAHDRMFSYEAEDGMHANGTSANGRQQDRSEQGLSDASNGQAKQQHRVDHSKRSVIKRLAAKRQAMSGFVSPAHGSQSPSSIGLSSNVASPSQSVSRGASLKRKPAEELSGPTASIRRMETALKGISQAEKAAEEEAAAGRAAAKGPARPPTAMLGFAPISHTLNEPPSATGKCSWPANFFDSSRKRHHAAAPDSENGSETSGAVQLESLGSGAESSLETAAVEADGGDGEIGQDYGAAWRDAAHYSPASPSPPPKDTGHMPQVASPPFRTASGNYPDPDLPSPSPTPPLAFSPSPIHQTPAPQSFLFELAASPATIPAKRFGSDAGTVAASTSTLDTGIPAMILSGTGKEAAFPSTEATMKPDSLLAHKGECVGVSGSEHDDEGKESAKPAAAASAWGRSFLKSNQSAAARATEAAAEADVEVDTSSGQPAIPDAPPPFKFGVTPTASGSRHSTSSTAPAPAWPLGTALFSFGIPPMAAAPSSHLAQVNAGSSGQPAASQPLSNTPQVPASAQDQLSAKNKDKVDKQDADASKPAATPSGLAPLAMQSNQADPTQAAQAADAAKQTTATTHPEAASAASTAAAAPLAASGWGNDSLHSNQQALPTASEAVVGAAKEDKPSRFTTLPTPLEGVDVMQSNQAAASHATQKESISQPAAVSAAPVASGWSAGFMQTNQAAAAQEANEDKGDQQQPAQAMAFSFGVPPAAAASQAASPPIAIPSAPAAADAPQDSSLARDSSMMSISPKSFGASQRGTTNQAPASQVAPPFDQAFTPAGFGQMGFGYPAGFGTLGFGQPQASSAGYGQLSQASLSGYGQQPQPNFAGFGQQPKASVAGFGAQAQQQAAPSLAFTFGQPDAAAASQLAGPALSQASHGGADAGQQPPSSFPQQNPGFAFGTGGSAGQPSGLCSGQGQVGSQAEAAQPVLPQPAGIPAFTLGAASNEARPASARRRVTLKRRQR